MLGNTFNIQRCCVHDGPGIRTTVFLKGCNLRCYWCHNPESFKAKPEIQIFKEKCIGCGECLQACDKKLHRNEDGIHIFDRLKCIGCGKCAEKCFSGCIVLSGKNMDSKEVAIEAKKDANFFIQSKGGVTLSGGEPLIQSVFCSEILQLLKEDGIHTAIETALNVDKEDIDNVLPFTDLFIIDIKNADSEKHLKATGASNEKILKNIEYVDSKAKPIWIRIPVIPSYNDSIEDMKDIADFVRKRKNVKLVELMPFHGLSIGKYSSLEKEYKAKDIKAPEKLHLQHLASAFDWIECKY
jgi:pyruvate formate lyase activating enzyme